MNPDSSKYDPTWIEELYKSAARYHPNPSVTYDSMFEAEVASAQQVRERLLRDHPNAPQNAVSTTSTPAPTDPLSRLQALKDLQVSGATEEEINDMIDYLHEVLLSKRQESLLDLEPGLE